MIYFFSSLRVFLGFPAEVQNEMIYGCEGRRSLLSLINLFTWTGKRKWVEADGGTQSLDAQRDEQNASLLGLIPTVASPFGSGHMTRFGE